MRENLFMIIFWVEEGILVVILLKFLVGRERILNFFWRKRVLIVLFKSIENNKDFIIFS